MRYAILIDGAFMLKRMKARLKREPTSADVIEECQHVQSCDRLKEHEHLRTLYYDAQPYMKSVPNLDTRSYDDLGNTELAHSRRALQSELSLAPFFALRTGEVQFEGYSLSASAAKELVRTGRPVTASDLRLKLTQKGVDMRIGLDIARLALRDRVGAIVVVTGDSDFIAAFKFARREGLQVFLYEMGGQVKVALKQHADVVLPYPLPDLESGS